MLSNGGHRTKTVAVLVGIVAVVGGLLAGRAVAETGHTAPAALAAHSQPLVDGTPCSSSARSCVDLESQQAWLIADGKVVRGPVKISSGGVGKETPVGHSFRVFRKEKDHKSGEFKLANGQPAPMPWSVFFADGGIAFHEGSLKSPSSGCVHLGPEDSKSVYDFLEVGDPVQVR
jgi:hypothetical protein